MHTDSHLSQPHVDVDSSKQDSRPHRAARFFFLSLFSLSPIASEFCRNLNTTILYNRRHIDYSTMSQKSVDILIIGAGPTWVYSFALLRASTARRACVHGWRSNCIPAIPYTSTLISSSSWPSLTHSLILHAILLSLFASITATSHDHRPTRHAFNHDNAPQWTRSCKATRPAQEHQPPHRRCIR